MALLIITAATLTTLELQPIDFSFSTKDGASAVGSLWSADGGRATLLEGSKKTKLASLMRMLRRSRDKLHMDQEKLKLQDGIARLRENSLLRILAREKDALHSRSGCPAASLSQVTHISWPLRELQCGMHEKMSYLVVLAGGPGTSVRTIATGGRRTRGPVTGGMRKSEGERRDRW